MAARDLSKVLRSHVSRRRNCDFCLEIAAHVSLTRPVTRRTVVSFHGKKSSRPNHRRKAQPVGDEYVGAEGDKTSTID
jgi:hypothetical protein